MSGAAASAGTSRFSAFLNHPAGPKTVYFWAPFMKWSLIAAGMKYRNRFADTEPSVSQSVALAASGAIWVRYSFVITPFSYSLAAVNFFGGATGQLKAEGSKIQYPTNLMSYLPSISQYHNYSRTAVNFLGGAMGQLKREASKIQYPTNLMSYIPSIKYQQKSKGKGDKETIVSKLSVTWK